MGLEYHGLSFLKYVSRQAPFGETLTIGRQEVHVSRPEMKAIMGDRVVTALATYCEPLLVEQFGATLVESVDNSAYEDATHVHNFNKPIPDDMKDRYDTVIDSGTLEHVFDIAQAFANCSALVRPGGQIIHVLPANNFCGHGFWQMSPELFFSLYSEKNGYRDTEVILAKLLNKRDWYKVHAPSNGGRVNVLSSEELYLLVRSVKAGAHTSQEDVQQSDYVVEWEERSRTSGLSARPGLKRRLANSSVVNSLVLPAYHRLLRMVPSRRATSRNPGLQAVSIRSLTH